MGVITERELAAYLTFADEAEKTEGKQEKMRGIDSIIIEEAKEGGFFLVLDLTYKAKGTVLYTARGITKTWANLNTLVSYIKTLESPKTPIRVQLLRGPNENTIDKGTA